MTLFFTLSHGLHLASLLSLFGAGVLRWRARAVGIAPPDPHALRLTPWLALVTAILNLEFTASEMAGTEWAGPSTLQSVLLHSTYGHVFAARAAILAGVLAVSRWQKIQTVLAGSAIVLLGITSHAAASGGAAYVLPRAMIDAAHLLTAGLWTGGLIILLPAALAARENPVRLARLLRTFSRYGVVSVAVLITAGTANAVAILGNPAMRWSALYASWLAVKIVLAALMAALALTNRLSVLPALQRGEAEAMDTVALTVGAELTAAFAIVLIAGFLGLTAPMSM